MASLASINGTANTIIAECKRIVSVIKGLPGFEAQPPNKEYCLEVRFAEEIQQLLRKVLEINKTRLSKQSLEGLQAVLKCITKSIVEARTGITETKNGTALSSDAPQTTRSLHIANRHLMWRMMLDNLLKDTGSDEIKVIRRRFTAEAGNIADSLGQPMKSKSNKELHYQRYPRRQVVISKHHSKEKQEKTIAFIQKAAENEIPISSLLLEESFEGVDVRQEGIILSSELRLLRFYSVRNLEIETEELRKFSELEVLELFTCTKQCVGLTKIMFVYCIMPQFIKVPPAMDTKVGWYLHGSYYYFNVEEELWQCENSKRLMNGELYSVKVSTFQTACRDEIRRAKSEGVYIEGKKGPTDAGTKSTPAK